MFTKINYSVPAKCQVWYLIWIVHSNDFLFKRILKLKSSGVWLCFDLLFTFDFTYTYSIFLMPLTKWTLMDKRTFWNAPEQVNMLHKAYVSGKKSKVGRSEDSVKGIPLLSAVKQKPFHTLKLELIKDIIGNKHRLELETQQVPEYIRLSLN